MLTCSVCRQIVQMAMGKLEDYNLSPIENIMLGKAHKLPTWMNEGYISLASESDLSSNFSLGELIDALGWETTGVGLLGLSSLP